MPSLAGTAGYGAQRVQPNDEEEEERLALLQAAVQSQQGETPGIAGDLFGGAGAALAEPQQEEAPSPVGDLFGGIAEDVTRGKRIDRLQDTGFLNRGAIDPSQSQFHDARMEARAAIAIRKLQEMREEQEKYGFTGRVSPSLSGQLRG